MSTKKAFMPELDYSVLEKDFNVFDPNRPVHMDSIPVETDQQGEIGEATDIGNSMVLPTEQVNIENGQTPKGDWGKKIQKIQQEYNENFIQLVSGLREKRRIEQIKKQQEKQQEQQEEQQRIETINHSDTSVIDPHNQPGFYMTHTGQRLIAIAKKLNDNNFIKEAAIILDLLKRRADLE